MPKDMPRWKCMWWHGMPFTMPYFVTILQMVVAQRQVKLEGNVRCRYWEAEVQLLLFSSMFVDVQIMSILTSQISLDNFDHKNNYVHYMNKCWHMLPTLPPTHHARKLLHGLLCMQILWRRQTVVIPCEQVALRSITLIAWSGMHVLSKH